MLQSLEKYKNEGLVVLRISFGLMYMAHGLPKLLAGPERWTGLGEFVGIGLFPTFFGFMAAFAEFFGGLFLVLGLFFSPALILLILTMIGATVAHISAGDPLNSILHPLKGLFVFIALLLLGPGRPSLDAALGWRRDRAVGR